ncbi:MAG: F0F1 ATP synthase subunit alpha [Verrucomicrobia bacterium GWC2_42_7]|nr:MAG: F0F1 ATP synthase subunit alpha [Verrucomicrobia bacterium GWC2_42_7]
MSTVIEQIQQEISKLETRVAKSNVGRIVSIADAVAKVDGLSAAMYNEMIEFPGNVFGIALNLEEDYVGVVILGDCQNLKEGDEAKTTGRLLSVPVGKELLGRVVDALGRPVDGKGVINTKEVYPVEKIAPGILPRQSVNQPLQTGITGIDAMIPIGRGQRELIIGDRSTGKTSIAIDAIINQAKINRQGLLNGDASFRPVYSIYVAIGQKNANIARLIKVLEEANALEYTVVVSASASDNPANQYIAPYSGTAIGEYFMENGMDALVIYDDLSKHATAYRQISLVLKRPSGREAFPGDIFYLHSRLLERSARLDGNHGGGSLTALPIIETQAGDISAYIPTNVISITDGQIFLETDLFNQGVRPAISIGISVSRVGSAAQIKPLKQVAGKLKLEMAQYRELAAFAQFGSDLDARTKHQLERGSRFMEVFKQSNFNPKPVEIQIAILWTVQNGFFDSIEVLNIQKAVTNLEDFLSSAKQHVLQGILQEGSLSDSVINELKGAVEEWKLTFAS